MVSRHHLSEKFISILNISVIRYKMEHTKDIFPENMIDGFWVTIKKHKLLIFIIVVIVALITLFETEKKEKQDTKKMEDIEKEEDTKKVLLEQPIQPVQQLEEKVEQK
jgi:hypothetical protein